MNSNNPFEVHGVKYLSATSINKFRKDPAKWLVNIAGYKDSIFSPPMSFGIAIEDGITKGVTEPDCSIEDCVKATNESYERIYDKILDNKAADYSYEKCHEKRDRVADLLTEIVPLYRKFGIPIATQKKISLEIEDIPIEIIGYVDYLYEDTVRDLKTTGMKPMLRSDYQRQLTIYHYATGAVPMIDFIYSLKTKRSLITMPIENVDHTYLEIKRICNKMMRLLSLSSNIREVAYLSCLEPDTSNEDFFKTWGTNEIIGANELFMY